MYYTNEGHMAAYEAEQDRLEAIQAKADRDFGYGWEELSTDPEQRDEISYWDVDQRPAAFIDSIDHNGPYVFVTVVAADEAEAKACFGHNSIYDLDDVYIIDRVGQDYQFWVRRP